MYHPKPKLCSDSSLIEHPNPSFFVNSSQIYCVFILKVEKLPVFATS